MLINDKNISFSTKALIKADKNDTLEINFVNNVINNYEDLKCHIKKNKYIKLCHS